MTEKIFLTDSYAKECEALVLKAEGKFIVPDKTVFYPQGGGQPCDFGKILRENGEEVKIVFAKNLGEEVSLEIERESVKAGEKIKCIVDWERRFKLMRMHTCAHILAAVLFKEFGALITGNQLEENESRMDFNLKEFEKEKLALIEAKANEAIAQNMEVSISFEEREKALKRPELFKLKGVLPKNLPVLRIVAIGNFDIQADGGTHVKNTSEIGKVKITDFKNKGAENRRIYWKME